MQHWLVAFLLCELFLRVPAILTQARMCMMLKTIMKDDFQGLLLCSVVDNFCSNLQLLLKFELTQFTLSIISYHF